MKFRQGTRIKRLVFAQAGPEPGDDDVLVALFEDPFEAKAYCRWRNAEEQGHTPWSAVRARNMNPAWTERCRNSGCSHSKHYHSGLRCRWPGCICVGFVG